MNEFDRAYLWQLVWWGLTSEKEIIDRFTIYDKGKPVQNLALDKHYKHFLKQKEQLLRLSKHVDFLKLNEAFSTLNSQGILALHYAGSTISAGHTIASETLQDIYQTVTKYRFPFDLSTIKGYCFYHEQDMEPFVPPLNTNTIPKASLHLAFGSFDDNILDKEIGQHITTILEQKELSYHWNKQATTRIQLKDFVWTKENDTIDWSNKAVDDILGKYQALRKEQTQQRTFELKQSITIIDGVFQNQHGVIQEIKEEGQTFVVEITVFGRTMLVEVDKEIIIPR